MEFWNFKWQWEDMCGPAGFHPWNETTKDLGVCFQQLCLQIPLYFIIAMVSGYYVGYRKDWVIREKQQDRILVLRSFIVLALVMIPIIEMYVYVTDPGFVLYPIDYFAAGSSCLCWLIHFGYVLALKQRLGPSIRGMTLLLVLWSCAVVLNVLSLRSSVQAGLPVATNIATICCHFLYFLTLIPSSHSRPTYYSRCLVGSLHNHNEYTPLLPHIDEGVLGTAMQGASWFSKLTFGWVEPLILKGLENKLNDPEELFDVPPDVACSYVGARMDKALIGNVDNYQQYEDVPHEPFISAGYGAVGQSVPQSSTPVTPTSRVLVRPRRRQNVTLLRALHSCFALQFYSIGILKFMSDMCGFVGPILLNKLVKFMQDETIDVHYGYIYAAGLFTASLLSALFNAHFNWLMCLIGIKMQGAIISTILGKTLSVTHTELTKVFSAGEITNFMSTDTDRIINSCPSFHALWSIPLQLVVTLYLLYLQVGISFLAGVGFSIVLIPINKVIANKIGKLSTEMMGYKDTRVNLITDLLRGIRTIKMHVWEDYFIDRVNESRESELRRLGSRKYLDAWCVVLWASTPVMVAAVTLGTHALRRGDLSAPVVFTTVALVNMLIAPLNAFPWVLNGLTEAWVSIKRIQKLLELPDMDPERYYDILNQNLNEDKIIIFNNATLSWAKPLQHKKTLRTPKKNKGKSKKRLSRSNIQRDEALSSVETLLPNEPFSLNNISLQIGREEFIGITGPVGSGKTSLLHAIIGDMIKKDGHIQIPENLTSFGYVSQTPWLVRGTIRDNILFGKPYDEAKFKAVVDACALTEELEALGWSGQVGERGHSLSGGQRARVALARAVYQDKQVYLLDDVFSGLDARVSHHVMQRCVLGLLGRRARVLVAHQHRHLARVDTALILHNGRIIRQGPPEVVLTDIEENMASDPDLWEKPQQRPETPPASILPAASIAPLTGSTNLQDQSDTVSRNSFNEDETMSEGSVDWWVIGMYLRSVGYLLSVAILLSLVLMQISQNFTFLWLAYWVKNRAQNSTSFTVEDTHDNFTFLDHGFNTIDNIVHSIINGTLFRSTAGNETDYKPILEEANSLTLGSTDAFYLEVYFGLAGVNLLFTIVRAFLFAYGGIQAASKIHNSLLRIVVKAKMKFFDTTPSGRIVNRFSSDTYTVDDTLPFILNILLAQFFSLVGAVSVTVYSLPWVMAAVVPLLPVYHWLQRRYRISSRQLRRLQSVTLAPVYTHFSDTLEGVTTIRALGASPRWRRAGGERVEAEQRAWCGSGALAAWLALRLQAAALAPLAAAALAAVLGRHLSDTDAGLVGLALSYALSMTAMVSGVMSAFTETEREIIAVERIGQYIREIEVEKIEGESPPYGWPSQGVISFENVVLNYSTRGERPAALRGVSLCTRPGERVGVAGRTGAGKSSLLLALLRLVAPTAGAVRLDGVDLRRLHLHALRSRIGVIPQEPFIFSGTVRENVDPLHVYSEPEVRRALERCGLRVMEGEGAREGAGTSVGEGRALHLHATADDMSRGGQQLLCLARALLQRPKILLIDEATANLDLETERIILDTIKCSFAGSTVLFVAHRVLGVLECDRVLVMGDGRVLEFAPPQVLLDNTTSHLYKLVHAHEETNFM